jgi:DNA polymerase-3 subunit epsilon
LDSEQRLCDTTFIAFDTETTGLTPIPAKLVEIGAVKFRMDHSEEGVFDTLIDPDEPIPEEAQSIHGITNDMVSGKPKIQEVLPAFIGFLGPPGNVLLAHNALFDLGFLVLDMLRMGLPLPVHRVFDTVLLARTIMPFLPGYRLRGLSAALGLSENQEHRALSDARLVKGLFLSLLDRADGIDTVSDLAALSAPVGFADAQVTTIEPPKGFEGLTAALDEGRPVEIIYAGGTEGPEPRRVTPRAVIESRGVLYLAGFCHAEGKDKMYRLSRIMSFTIRE